MKKILVFLCTISLLLCSIGTVSALTLGNDIIARPSVDGANNIAFIDPTLAFPTDGVLEGWEFYLTAGTIEFATQIYRYTGTDDVWELVYTKNYSGGTISAGSYFDGSTPFSIQAGDVIGWWFGDAEAVIPFTGTGEDDVEWSNYLSVPITAPVLGQLVNFDTESWRRSSQKREYSIAANYSVPEPATMFLLGTGLIGLVAIGRNKILKK